MGLDICHNSNISQNLNIHPDGNIVHNSNSNIRHNTNICQYSNTIRFYKCEWILQLIFVVIRMFIKIINIRQMFVKIWIFFVTRIFVKIWIFAMTWIFVTFFLWALFPTKTSGGFIRHCINFSWELHHKHVKLLILTRCWRKFLSKFLFYFVHILWPRTKTTVNHLDSKYTKSSIIKEIRYQLKTN